MSISFPGSDRMIAAIDAAVQLGDCKATTAALRQALCQLIRDPEVRLPPDLFTCCGEHYARRELYRSSEHDYAVIAMTWGPGQGTAIHDHSGMWCVEGVFAGSLEITQYALRGENGETFQFENCGTMVAGPGSAGSLIPPHEYHTIRNASNEQPAVSVHIYARPMTRCAIYEPTDQEGWHRRSEKLLSLD